MEKDNYVTPSAAEAEMMIRDIVGCSINEKSEAKNIAIGIMGLCRSLNTIATMALEDSDNKHLCSEAASTIAVASTCERMIRSITGFYLIENYMFHDDAVED